MFKSKTQVPGYIKWGGGRIKNKKSISWSGTAGNFTGSKTLEGRNAAKRFILEKFGFAMKNMPFPLVATNKPF